MYHLQEYMHNKCFWVIILLAAIGCKPDPKIQDTKTKKEAVGGVGCERFVENQAGDLSLVVTI